MDRTLGGAYGLVAIAALASLAMGILWSLDTATHVERWQETRLIDPWVERGAFTYEPQSTDPASPFPMGEPGYFTTDAPIVRVRFAWTLDDPGAERVTAVASLRVVISQPGGSGRAAWTHEELLDDATFAGAPDEPLVLTGDVDLPALEATIRETPRRDPASATWSVIARVRFESAPHDAHRADASEFTLPLTYTPPLYVLPGEDEATQTKDHTAHEIVPHERRAGLEALAARPIGPALAVLGAIAVLYALPRAMRPAEDAP